MDSGFKERLLRTRFPVFPSPWKESRLGNFQDEKPSGNEVEVLDPEFEEDINAED